MMVQRKTAAKYLDMIVDSGLLQKVKMGTYSRKNKPRDSFYKPRDSFYNPKDKLYKAKDRLYMIFGA